MTKFPEDKACLMDRDMYRGKIDKAYGEKGISEMIAKKSLYRRGKEEINVLSKLVKVLIWRKYEGKWREKKRRANGK